MYSIRTAIFVAAFASAVAAPPGAHAQRLLPIGGDGRSLHLEITKPFVSGGGLFDGARRATSVWDASVVVPLESGPTLFARWGFAYASIEGVDDGLTTANPRVGAMWARGAGQRAELHVDLPLAKELGLNYATGIGIYSDYEELERFVQDTWSVGASASTEADMGGGSFLGAGLGSVLLIPTDGDADLVGLFSLFGHAPTDRTRFRFEFSGRVLATEPGLSFSDRTTFFATLDLSWPLTRFAPGLFVRAPIDDTLDGTVALVAGLHLQLGG